MKDSCNFTLIELLQSFFLLGLYNNYSYLYTFNIYEELYEELSSWSTSQWLSLYFVKRLLKTIKVNTIFWLTDFLYEWMDWFLCGSSCFFIYFDFDIIEFPLLSFIDFYRFYHLQNPSYKITADTNQ